ARLGESAALRQWMGENGRARAERFGFEHQHQRFDALYRSLLGAGRPARLPGPDAGLGDLRLTDVERVTAALADAVPADARVLVVSRGDDELVELDGWRGSHFPQDESGVYAGFYPEDSAEAIGHLEDLRTAGAEYLVFPPTAMWWLEHYRGLRTHLERSYRFVPTGPDDCAVVALAAPADGRRAGHR
ncbi:MAG: hypothetical protein M3203_14340, partial [Actinomycetota bacterium]|nr:hypothetical protein [Actinomycetota bacterium]